MLDQDRLQAEYLARVEQAPQGLPQVAALCVVKDVRFAAFVRSSRDFVARMPPEERESWSGSFTRTIFLAGDPENLAERHPPDLLAEDGSVAWYAPGPVEGRMALRRLLRPFRGTRPGEDASPERIPFGGTGSRTAKIWVLDSLPLQDVLVHLNHLIAEAALSGLFEEVSELAFEHVREIPDSPAFRTRLRIAEDRDQPGRLRCYAALVTNQAAA